MIKTEAGQSLIEVLAALTATAVVIIALATVSISGLKNSQFAQNQTKATKYAQNLLEKVKTIKERNLSVTFMGADNSSYNATLSEFFYNNDENKCPDVDNPCYFQLRETDPNNPLDLIETTPTSRYSIPGETLVYEIAMWRAAVQEENVRVKVFWKDNQGEHNSNLQTVLTSLGWVPTPTAYPPLMPDL